jgi:hypothetical protein
MLSDIQERIWKSYFSNIVLEQYNKYNNSAIITVEKFNKSIVDYDIPVNIRWCSRWHNFIPFQASVSGQRQVHIEYAKIEEKYMDEFGDYKSDDTESEDEDEDESEYWRMFNRSLVPMGSSNQ